MRKLFYANGRHWAFYITNDEIYYRSSTDGISWSSRTYVCPLNILWGFDLWFDGTYLHYANFDTYTTDWCIEYRRGIPESDGSITWSADAQYAELGTDAYWGTITVARDGSVYISYDENLGGGYEYPTVTKNKKKDGTWETEAGWPKRLSTTPSGWFVRVLPL
mgnify:CR=1 FL=1